MSPAAADFFLLSMQSVKWVATEEDEPYDECPETADQSAYPCSLVLSAEPLRLGGVGGWGGEWGGGVTYR